MKGILADLLIRLGLDSKEYEKGVDDTKKKSDASFTSLKAVAVAAWAAIGVAAVDTFNKIKSTSDTLSTQWDAFIGGMNSATDTFFRTIATGDWSNFFDNMKEAIKLGRDYVNTLDDIEDMRRTLTVTEAKQMKQNTQLEIDAADQTKTKEQREAAAKQRIANEEELARVRIDIAKRLFKAELEFTAHETKLSEERLMAIISDYDSIDKTRAKSFNEAYKQLDWAVRDEKTAREIFKDMYTQTEMDYGFALQKMGDTTDEQMDKMVKSFYDLAVAEDSVLTNTRRIRIRLAGLISGEDIEKADDLADSFKKVAEAAKKIPKREEIVGFDSMIKPVTDTGTFADTSGNLGKLGLQIPAGFQTEAMKNAADKEAELLAQRSETWENFKNDMASMVVDFGVNVVEEFGQSLGEMLATGDFPADFGKNILAGIGGFISQLGKMMIQMGIAAGAFQKLLASSFMNPIAPGLLVAAGLGLVLLGGAIQGFAKAGPTGSGASSSVSTPSYSRAGSTSQGYRAEDNKVVFEIKGDKLVGVLNNVQRKNLNMA